ncbi:MAG: hypothetical protein JO153_11295 [Solirubrobacterales bacterium]|nr:hypothetical protein [Solirubrobacterales bacterium]
MRGALRMTLMAPALRMTPVALARRITLVALALSLVGAGAARAGAPAYVAQPPSKGAFTADGNWNRYLLGGTWLLRADPSNAGVDLGWWRATATTAGWSPVTVPNSYNADDFSNASMSGSVSWYRRDFTLPAQAFPRYVRSSERHWIVRFESVNYRATVWLNGRQIGSHAGAYVPFELDLTGLRPGVNRLIVRVDDRRSGSDLPPGPGGGWWNFGGILREVYLRPVARADLAQVLVSPQLPCPTCAATVQFSAVVRNLTGSRQALRLNGRYGGARINFGSLVVAPQASVTVRTTLRIAHPRLWSPDHPTLYLARLALWDSSGRRQLTGYTVHSGIRSIAVVGGRLTLNGRALNLRGVNLHEQDIRLGAALDRDHMRRLVGWVRSLGATMIRAHYPVSPYIEELADRYGLLIWSEVPVYQVNDQYVGQAGWRARAAAALQSDILANFNHAAILVWSLGNELNTPPTAAQAGYIAASAALAHELDPTRPVGMAISDWPGVACQPAYAPLDVIGVNEYFGWYDAGGGSTDDRDALGPFLDSLRACYPSKALMVTEFGFEASRDGPVEERGTYEFQADATAYHLSVFAARPWLSAALYFALQDFAVKPGWSGGNPWPNPPFLQKGVFDLAGNPKPVFGVLSSSFHATAQIARAPTTAGRREAVRARAAGKGL